MAHRGSVPSEQCLVVTLDNGLRVLVQPEHTAPLVSVWSWYRVGSKDETPGRTGASHWVEHMNFKGTERIPPSAIQGIIEQCGGHWNGYTWIDQTAYLETATKDALDRMLFIEAERMASCLYREADVDAERTVVISELQGGENDPAQLLDRDVTAAAFRVHPYGQPTIGWLADLQAMTRDDLYAHYRRFYIPNNASIVVVGDVDADHVIGRVQRHFGTIASGPRPPRVAAVEPPQTEERRITLLRGESTRYLSVAFHAPAFHEPTFLPALLLDAALTGAKGVNLWSSFSTPPAQRQARLYRALVDGGVAASVHGTIMPTAQPYLYTLAATVADGVSLDQAEAALDDELDRVRRVGLEPADLDRAKAQLKARLVFDADSVTHVAHQLGYFDAIGGLDWYHALLPSLASVTLDAVNSVGTRMLASANRTVGRLEREV